MIGEQVSGATQLVELSFPTTEVHSSNPVISKIYIEHLFIVNFIEKMKITKKRQAGNDPFKNITEFIVCRSL